MKALVRYTLKAIPWMLYLWALTFICYAFGNGLVTIHVGEVIPIPYLAFPPEAFIRNALNGPDITFIQSALISVAILAAMYAAWWGSEAVTRLEHWSNN
jgi:hypothetical protein